MSTRLSVTVTPTWMLASAGTSSFPRESLQNRMENGTHKSNPFIKLPFSITPMRNCTHTLTLPYSNHTYIIGNCTLIDLFAHNSLILALLCLRDKNHRPIRLGLRSGFALVHRRAISHPNPTLNQTLSNWMGGQPHASNKLHTSFTPLSNLAGP